MSGYSEPVLTSEERSRLYRKEDSNRLDSCSYHGKPVREAIRLYWKASPDLWDRRESFIQHFSRQIGSFADIYQ